MNFFKVVFRSLKRNGFYSVINISGLAIGMAAAILLLVWVYNEWSYDRFHAKEKQLYQVWSRGEFNGKVECWGENPVVMGPTLKADYPEVEEMTRMDTRSMLYTLGENRLKMKTTCVDPGFLTMFSFPLLQGNMESALKDPYSVILTEQAAQRLFGSEDPMGKVLLCDAQYSMTVTGVMKDLPRNTSFEFDVLLPFTFAESHDWYKHNDSWGAFSVSTYIELQSPSQESGIDQSIQNIIKEHSNNEVPFEAFIYPLSRVHLYSKFENGVPAGGLVDTLQLFGLIALLILLIACINFMNLSTARSAKRAKEVGVRKVMGAKRISLISQFLGESTIVAFLAGLLAIVIATLVLPAYSTLMGKTLSLNLGSVWFWLTGLVFVFFTGLLAGSYPAFHLSSFLPVKVLKGTFKAAWKVVSPRKVLVVVQFTVAICLIIATLVIHRQIYYVQDRDSGYNKEQLIYQEINGDIAKNYALIKQDLLASGTAISVTRTNSPMTDCNSSALGVQWKGILPDDKTLFDLFFVDADWTGTVGTTIVEGRDIDIYTYPTDATAVLLNESALKAMNLDHPIGETVRLWGREGHVIGVVKDFILRSPYNPMMPMIIGGPGIGSFGTIHIRLNGENKTADNLAAAEKIFRQYNPAYPFEYKFIDEEYAHKFQEEQKMGSLATGFAILAIVISCMGLFALVAYMAETRKKEIGIRKVLGASVTSVTSLLSKEFLILVLISLAVASPIAWWAMNKWLAKYAYHTNIPWWIFIVVGCVSLSIALLTVSFQAIKAATANPVKAIKAE